MELNKIAFELGFINSKSYKYLQNKYSENKVKKLNISKMSVNNLKNIPINKLIILHKNNYR